MNGPVNILAHVPLSWQHRGDLLSYEQRKKVNRLIRLAKKQGGIRCANGYVVPCCYCFWWHPLSRLTIEHLVNQSDGGGSTQDNLALACYACNNGRNNREHLSLRKFGLEKWVRRRLHNFTMDMQKPRIIVEVRGAKLRLRPLRLEYPW